MLEFFSLFQAKAEDIRNFLQYLEQALNFQNQEAANLRHGLEQISLNHNAQLSEKTHEVAILMAEVDRLSEELRNVDANKQSEQQSLFAQLSEKESRLEQLLAASAEEAKQAEELKKQMEAKEQQIQGLTQQLEEKAKEYELAQHALQRHVAGGDANLQPVHASSSLDEFHQRVMLDFFFVYVADFFHQFASTLVALLM